MLLITNLPVTKAKDAIETYLIYLKRAKIEGLFKFLKNALAGKNSKCKIGNQSKISLRWPFSLAAIFMKLNQNLPIIRLFSGFVNSVVEKEK